MATILSVSEARATLPEVLERVRNGEEITLTRHGEPIAVVVRPDVLRVRRGEAVHAAATELGRRIRAARREPRPVVAASSRKRAEALIAEVRAGRSRA